MKDDIINDFNNGVSIYQLVKKYKVNYKTIGSILNANGIDVKKYYDDLKLKAVELYNNGMSMNRVASELSIGLSTVQKVLKKCGVSRSISNGVSLIREQRDNKIIDSVLPAIINDYNNMSICEIASKYGYAKRVISRLLKQSGIDTKKWIGGRVIGRRSSNVIEDKYPKLKDANWLTLKYNEVGSVEKLADEIGCSYTAVRNRLNKYGISINTSNSWKPKKFSRGRVVVYNSPKINKTVKFRSVLECAYAMLLDKDVDVLSWDYELIKMVYFDGFTGKQRTYICDFMVERNEVIEHIEVKPVDQQMPTDKYLYAKNCITNWRFITEDEIKKADDLFRSGYNSDSVDFPAIYTNTMYCNIWSKRDIVVDAPWVLKSSGKYGVYFKHRLYNPEHINKNIKRDLGLDKIIDMVKADMTLTNVAKELGVGARTVNSILERNSYTVRWGNVRRRNEIKYATKKIWPIDSLIKQHGPLHGWDNYEWLHEHYINKSMSTRAIGKMVNKSGRLIYKKLLARGVPIRSRKNKV